jgi:hypothetical protein
MTIGEAVVKMEVEVEVEVEMEMEMEMEMEDCPPVRNDLGPLSVESDLGHWESDSDLPTGF